MMLFIALAGGLGAAARLFIDGLIRDGHTHRFPWATNIINITGALLLGLVYSTGSSADWHSIAGVGFLGGYTTFSTASWETARLAHDGRYRSALANGLGQLVIAIAAASLGVWIGSTAR